MTASVRLWSTTPGSNSGLDSAADFPEGMARSAVNDMARGMEAAIKRESDDRSGGVAAGGTADAITITTASTWVSGDLANKARVSFRATATNTATAPTVAIDGLTAKTIFREDGSALVAGDITSGGIYDLSYSSVAGGFLLLNPSKLALATIATQAEQETGTSLLKLVTPGRQQYHASAAKFWCEAQSDGTAAASYNVTTVGDTGAGVVTLTYTVNFSGTAYVVVVTSRQDSAATAASQRLAQVTNTTHSASQVQITSCRLSDFAHVDPNTYQIAGYGDQ